VTCRYVQHSRGGGSLTGPLRKLPGWIASTLRPPRTGGLGEVVEALGAFFEEKERAGTRG
jgi:hypothetical protein